ncbi:hypothetical protein HZB02_02990 [Candidatus Woesearchaeota archaeon]|nr:hypothetical protein [Candidatus Woesearchaeota archaeon]
MEDTVMEDARLDETDDERKKREQRSTRNLVFAVLIVLAVTAVIIFLTMRSSQTTLTPLGNDYTQLGDGRYLFNGFSIQRAGKLSTGESIWTIFVKVNASVYGVDLRYDPLSVEAIPVEKYISERIIAADTIFLTVDPASSSRYVMAMTDVGKVLGTRYAIYNKEKVYTAFTSPSPNVNDTLHPIVTCDDATNQTVVILFADADVPGVRAVNNYNCIIVQGKEGTMDVVKAADRLVYGLFGVMH